MLRFGKSVVVSSTSDAADFNQSHGFSGSIPSIYRDAIPLEQRITLSNPGIFWDLTGSRRVSPLDHEIEKNIFIPIRRSSRLPQAVLPLAGSRKPEASSFFSCPVLPICESSWPRPTR